MAVEVTNARVERRTDGVRFFATSDRGAGEFLISYEALSDLTRESDLSEAELLSGFEDHADEIAEAAGIAIAQGRAGHPNRIYVIGSGEMPGSR